MIIVKKNDIVELGKPIKETNNKLFFQLGSVWKHSINAYHFSQTLTNFRKFVNDKALIKMPVASNLIN